MLSGGTIITKRHKGSVASFDLSRIEKINPTLNLRADQGDFPDLGPGGIDDPTLDDGEHIILKCSSCRAPLVDIWLTQPEITLKSKVRANCPHCDGECKEREVSGGFHLGATDYTQISDTSYLNAEYVLTQVVSQDVLVSTVKGKKYG